ncbi:pilus assembly protein TadG-related protein [Jannaschia aquimarina]|uniref:von Willebrand factor type A domain protein n=1 Tax=Jannaschia aquimarina TaxID=935700 RepID=A0A0D1CP55_9RHOB|nr:pilus assembly protein TadG-related protein [Jannaschia aquimarina]KIT16552.1 von Willebrand factor type A domain protein [Jannaschia aquimarina]SNT05862.1 Flp pilus assembly protein TadG [Jannaschia aquimarina]
MFVTSLKSRLKSTASGYVSGFVREERGAMTILSAFLFIMMMLAGGVALDFMRFETERARIQYTLDRASLAAASLSQTNGREAVIRDYFRAAGLGGYDLDVEIYTEGNSVSVVKATSSAPVRSMFLDMLGVESLTAPASAQAEERRSNIEISLVLDVSGSMAGEKIEALRGAAQGFVDEVFVTDDPAELAAKKERVSVSLVPYEGKVNVGSVVSKYYDLDPWHTLSACARWDNSDFTELAVADNRVLKRIAHFDHWSGGPHAKRYLDPWKEKYGGLLDPYCQLDDTNAIIPFSNDPDDLKSKIGNLKAVGWTAIDHGAKWGTVLLDPSANSRVVEMISDDEVDSSFALRPSAYGDEQTIKALVIMTDGANTRQHDLKPDRRGDIPSPIYAYHDDFDDIRSTYAGDPVKIAEEIKKIVLEDRSDTEYSIFLEKTSEEEEEPIHYEWKKDKVDDEPVGGTSKARQLTWGEVASIFSHVTVADHILPQTVTRNHVDTLTKNKQKGKVDGITVHDDDFRSIAGWKKNTDSQGGLHEVYRSTGQADKNLKALCDKAKAEGVIIYTIAFKAASGGQKVMSYCATSTSTYFQIEKSDQNSKLDDAFDKIAQTINVLKLTQ